MGKRHVLAVVLFAAILVPSLAGHVKVAGVAAVIALATMILIQLYLLKEKGRDKHIPESIAEDV